MNDFHHSLRKKNFKRFLGASVFSIFVNPLWSVFDYNLEPENWLLFLEFRIITAIIHVLMLIIISQKRFRKYTFEAIWILTVSIEIEIAVMFPFLESDIYPYVLGFTLPFLLITILTSIPFIYPLTAFIVSVLSFITGFAFRTKPLTFEEIIFLFFFISTSFGVGLLSAFLSYRIARNEFYLRQKIDRMKSNFFANISHEFRTPLTLILGPANRLFEKYKQTSDSADLNLIRRNALRLQVLINQLLDLSKMEVGKLKLKAGNYDIIHLTRAILSSFDSHARQRNITLSFEHKLDSLFVFLDQDKYEKILNNLLFNAFKFSDNNTRIVVSIERAQKDAIIRVQDQGIGIEKERLNYIFDRFYQVESNSNRTYEGTGIGLSLVKDLIEMHHGKIEAESTPGEGTTFCFNLPLGRAHLSKYEITEKPTTAKSNANYIDLEMRGEKSLENVKKGKPLILIVEDNYDMQSYILAYLKDDYSVKFAVNGKLGFDAAIQWNPLVIVSDVMMPVMDGMEMCRHLKTDVRSSHIPVILLTAKADEVNKLKGLKTGADEYLYKPFNPFELKIRIENLIENRRKLQQHVQKAETLDLDELNITSADEQFLNSFYKIVNENIRDVDFNVETLVNKIAISRSHLHKKIKALTGLSTTAFLKNIKLRHAARLLDNNFGNISEIAFESGFSNPSYFSESFKTLYHCSPSEYANRRKMKHI